MSKFKLFIEEFNTLQTLLGLDFGDKTIGIAVSDKTLTIATPLITIKRKGIQKDILELKNIFKEYNVGGVVLGLPLSLNGHENERTKKVRFFAKEMNKITNIKFTFYDERFSTDVIFKELRKQSISISKIKNRINHMAASYILQGFLDTNIIDN
jgi:putative Holliday junction resolvase